MNTLEIKKWFLDKGLKRLDVAKKARVSGPLVTLVIKGERRQGVKAKKVLRVLKRLGCPPEFLENSGQGSVASGQ